MPELPDVVVYIERLTPLVLGQPLVTVRLPSPFVLRTVEPPISEVEGRSVTGIRRLGKRIVLALEGELFIVIHLMIAGRLRWRVPAKTLKGKMVLAEFGFPDGTLYLTEAGSKRRASLHVVRGEAALAAFERGGLEVLGASLAEFSQRLRSENHTLKRSLTDPRLMSGIGNAYSDEILHRAKLSPLMLSSRIDDEQVAQLFERDAQHAHRMDRPAPRRGRRQLPGEGDRLSRRDGGAWPLPKAVPGMRRAGAAHSLRGERDQLLRALPDRRPRAGRPEPVATAQGRLAPQHR